MNSTATHQASPKRAETDEVTTLRSSSSSSEEALASHQILPGTPSCGTTLRSRDLGAASSEPGEAPLPGPAQDGASQLVTPPWV